MFEKLAENNMICLTWSFRFRGRLSKACANAKNNCDRVFRIERFVQNERNPWPWVPLVARLWLPADLAPREMSCTTDSECVGKSTPSSLYPGSFYNRSFIPTYSYRLPNRIRDRSRRRRTRTSSR